MDRIALQIKMEEERKRKKKAEEDYAKKKAQKNPIGRAVDSYNKYMGG